MAKHPQREEYRWLAGNGENMGHRDWVPGNFIKFQNFKGVLGFMAVAGNGENNRREHLVVVGQQWRKHGAAERRREGL
ncbi:hypothetical protein L1987_10969 [Smallanthus sonchifolius]|uniref:Uncharacterized protein n=1 Tax=Smallanthus sonchifolius TaxID=185202 RepID=A0ACB9JBP6_9ASTR|nr:hypothetical protein L1987_10969 [Smallanthus sonchifolius]